MVYRNKSTLQYSTQVALLVMLFVYYLSFVGSMVFSAIGNDTAAFYSAPYLEQAAKQMILKDEDKNGEYTKMITWFHAMNPDVHAELGKKTEDSRPREAMTHFYLANKYDPQNLTYYGQYIKYALATNNKKQVARGLLALIDTLEKQQKKLIISPALDDERVYPFLTKEALSCILEGSISRVCFSKIYYLIGLSMLKLIPDEGIEFLRAARDIAPNYGYYHIELASAYKYVLKNEEKYLETIDNCIETSIARDHCKKEDKSGVSRPGFYKTKILKIL